MSARRRRFSSSTIASIVAALCLGSSGVAHAEVDTDTDTNSRGEANRIGGYAFDLGILRPAGVLETVIGAVLLVPAYPLGIGSQQRSSIVARLVTDPARDTFTRPIGDF